MKIARPRLRGAGWQGTCALARFPGDSDRGPRLGTTVLSSRSQQEKRIGGMRVDRPPNLRLVEMSQASNPQGSKSPEQTLPVSPSVPSIPA